MAGKRTGTSKKRQLILAGGKTPQLKKKSPRKWSKRRVSEFLKVLGETCNVSEACRSSGLPMTVAYRHRKSDAAFRAEWLETIRVAYQRLELALLERSMNGTEKVFRRHDGSEDRMIEFPNNLGLKLLQMHRNTAADMEAEAELPPGELEELREQLLNKIERLKKRREQEQARRA